MRISYRSLAALTLLFTLAVVAAPPGARLMVQIKSGRATPSNLDIASRKTDQVYFQNNDSVTYKIVWTDKNYGSPFVAPNTPADKSSFNVEPFQGPAGPRKVHDAAKSGQRYSYDIMTVRDGKTSRAGSGTVTVE